MTIGAGVGSKGTISRGGNGIVWQHPNPFDPGGKASTLILRMSVGLAAFTSGFAKRVQDYARENAPWENRTGDARQGLVAKAEQRLWTYTITLSHTVNYGIWLEVRWDGKYAIILPTLEHMGPIFMAELDMAALVT